MGIRAEFWKSISVNLAVVMSEIWTREFLIYLCILNIFFPKASINNLFQN